MAGLAEVPEHWNSKSRSHCVVSQPVGGAGGGEGAAGIGGELSPRLSSSPMVAQAHLLS